MYNHGLNESHEKNGALPLMPNDKSGESTVRTYSVFDGISVVYFDIHSDSVEFNRIPDGDYLVVTHCEQGRIEYNIGGGECIFLCRGDLSIRRACSVSGTLEFPCSHYHGISVIADVSRACSCLSCFLGSGSVSPEAIAEKFCSGGCTVFRENSRIGHIFYELYNVPEEIRESYLKIKVLELMLFLSCVTPDEKSEKSKITGEQLSIAKAAKRLLITDYDKRITIAELSRNLGVSPTNLKRIFKEVYGDTVYGCVKNYRIRKAAYLLRTTEKSVLEIAGLVGYSNAGKFTQAFKSVNNYTPSEYRKML